MKFMLKLKQNVMILMLGASCLTMLGCSTTVPLKMPFPEVPENLMEKSTNLKPLPEDKKTLADLIENANENFSAYYILKEKYDAWQEWYKMQRRIHESVK